MSGAERMARMRARRAAEIEAADPPLRDADELLAPAVEEAVAALKPGERDAAVVALARRYASVIDGAQNRAAALKTLGPSFLKVLVALHATPSTRPPGKPARTGPNRVRELAAAHQLAKRRRGG